MATTVVIAAGVRTPIGKYGGAFRDVHPRDLAIPTLQHALQQAKVDPQEVADRGVVIYGCARQASYGPNLARQIAIKAGLGDTTPAWTVNQACASGLRALIDATQEVQNGDVTVAVAGGAESMSGLPYYVLGARWGMRLGGQE
ncbi:MAG TPA: beta-ketoacyl synthase N-terminal-like domain-containing protein, partial [bacterium]|nr:beta-ketoacyl synthase N-terminal-like domain-containing protein [bacterium]